MEMADHEDAEDSQFVSDLGWFVTGAVVGLAAALLLAPQSGQRTRRFIGDKTQQGRDAITGTGKDVYERSKEVLDKGRQLLQDAAELFESGRRLVRG
jgi:gas vesicle protein